MRIMGPIAAPHRRRRPLKLTFGSLVSDAFRSGLRLRRNLEGFEDLLHVVADLLHVGAEDAHLSIELLRPRR